MRQCPKCQANISDTAKFCMECGCNIKKYEEEQAQPKARFCPECGTKFSGGVFCPECGFNVTNELNGQAVPSESDTFGDGWLSDLESSSNADVATMKAQKSKEQTEKALSAFEYEPHSDGTYTIVSLKDKHALNITVPEGVVAIADHAFEGCEAFSISLPEGLLKIGNAAFKSSADLSSINFPQSLLSIGDEAFADCEMLDIEIPVAVCRVGKNAILNTMQDKKRQAEEEARKAEEARIVELAKYQIGKIVTFGSYVQLYKKDIIESSKLSIENYKSPIEWIVLDRVGSKALLISRKQLETKKYNTKFVSTTWKNSRLREWLNNEFLKEAFTDVEQQKIIPSTLNSKKYSFGDDIITTDKIFVLSIDEANRYFVSDDKRICAQTSYAFSKEHFITKGNGYPWWLRSQGSYSDRVAYITEEGVVCIDGNGVIAPCGVRPAMWIEI